MKNLFSLLAIAGLLLCAFTAQAQNTYGWQTLIATNTATCDATAGTNVAKTLDCRMQSSVELQIELMADASGAYTFTVPILRSVDGVTYANMAASLIQVSYNGVTKQTLVTNIPTYGAGYLKIPHLTNHTASINVTNIILKAGLKSQSP